MKYRVLTGFYDLEDGQRRYEAGDHYPRPGLTVTPERVAYLAGSENRLGRAVIEGAATGKADGARSGLTGARRPGKRRMARETDAMHGVPTGAVTGEADLIRQPFGLPPSPKGEGIGGRTPYMASLRGTGH